MPFPRKSFNISVSVGVCVFKTVAKKSSNKPSQAYSATSIQNETLAPLHLTILNGKVKQRWQGWKKTFTKKQTCACSIPKSVPACIALLEHGLSWSETTSARALNFARQSEIMAAIVTACPFSVPRSCSKRFEVCLKLLNTSAGGEDVAFKKRKTYRRKKANIVYERMLGSQNFHSSFCQQTTSALGCRWYRGKSSPQHSSYFSWQKYGRTQRLVGAAAFCLL